MYIIYVKVIFEAYLSEPPSSVHCFRDATLYAACLAKLNVLIECDQDNKDFYYTWLKNNGAYDFVDEIVEVGIEKGYRIGTFKANLQIERIDYSNLNTVINFIRKLKG